MALKTTAQNKKDVDEMSKADRLWDSLSYTYGQQTDKSNKAYDKAISQQDRTMLGRGMQRSSYGMNTLAGLQNQKINAANDIESQKIADYENRLYQLEKDEDEKAYRDKTFDEQVRQFDANLKFQQDEAARAQGNVDREYNANRSDVAWSQKQTELQNEYKKQQDALAQENLLRQEAYQKEQDAIQNAMTEKTFEANKANTEWNQQYQQAAFEYQKQQDAIQNALAQSQFDFSKASEDQKYVYNYIVTAAANGGDVSDDLLERAGISRADYNAMKAAAKSGGGGGGTRAKKTTEETEPGANGNVTDAYFDGLMGSLGGAASFIKGSIGTGSSTAFTLPTTLSQYAAQFGGLQNAPVSSSQETTDDKKKKTHSGNAGTTTSRPN